MEHKSWKICVFKIIYIPWNKIGLEKERKNCWQYISLLLSWKYDKKFVTNAFTYVQYDSTVGQLYLVHLMFMFVHLIWIINVSYRSLPVYINLFNFILFSFISLTGTRNGCGEIPIVIVTRGHHKTAVYIDYKLKNTAQENFNWKKKATVCHKAHTISELYRI